MISHHRSCDIQQLTPSPSLCVLSTQDTFKTTSIWPALSSSLERLSSHRISVIKCPKQIHRSTASLNSITRLPRSEVHEGQQGQEVDPCTLRDDDPYTHDETTSSQFTAKYRKRPQLKVFPFKTTATLGLQPLHCRSLSIHPFPPEMFWRSRHASPTSQQRGSHAPNTLTIFAVG